MADLTGKTILHYKLIRQVGEGGMGVVYLAEDMKLDRKVAIKFLPRFIAGNSNERKRFEIEAKAAAALNHPNIATIHAIEEVENDMFIVMEYIDGMELKEKLKSGPLNPDEAKHIALQIARGLQAAHEQHITHRDIKSTNIMINDKGQVKIMDFGLAKVRGGAELTKEQSTIGTAAYMSPEQASGAEIDHRTDIWSFGIVFYEMLTGELLFKGDYEQAVIFAILNDEIDFSDLTTKKIPSDVIEVLNKTLEKNINQRFRSAADIIALLTQTKQTAIQTKSKTQYIIYGVFVILIVILLLWNQFGTQEGAADKPETKFTKITFDAGLEDEPTFSPDGKFLAYTVDDRENFDIIVKPLDGGKQIRIVDHQSDDAQPSWSPDGSTIAFVSSRDHADHLSIILAQAPLTQYIYAKNGDIFTVPALGGQQIKIVENGYYPQWSPDGKMLTYQSNTGGNWDIWIISLKGGNPVRLTNDEMFNYHPTWSNDGRWIIYASRPDLSKFSIKAVSSSGEESVVLLETEDLILDPRLSRDDNYLIFSSTRSGAFNITKVPIEIDGFRIQENYQSITLSESDDVNLSIASQNQRIAYSGVTNNADIYELALNTKSIKAMTSDNANNDVAQLSADGSQLLFSSNRGGMMSAWIKNLTANEMFSLETGTNIHRWSPDGSSIMYPTEGGLAVKKLGDANEKILIAKDGDSFKTFGFPMMSWNGQSVAFQNSGITVYNLKDKTSIQLTENTLDNHPTWSPDDQTIVFQRGQGMGRDLYSIDLQGNETQLTSGDSEDSHPFWSRINPDQILFVRDHKNLFLLTVSTGEIKQITNYKKANISLDYPSFSFDGTKVYFSLFNKIGDIFILENF
jgi:serine/threonine protein kinase